MTDLKIISMNCRGLAQQHKRRDVLNYLKNQSADIIFLQETHMTVPLIPYFDSLWEGKCYHSVKTAKSRGTATLMKGSLSYELISQHCSEEGNLVILACKINNNKFTLVNLYGPNDDTPSFYRHIEQLLEMHPSENIIIGGDFNFVIDRINDSNYEQENNSYAKTAFMNLSEKYSLVDTWRQKHPNERQYTWIKQNPLKYGRLDMFFTSKHLTNQIRYANIETGYRTDHCAVSVTLASYNQERGPGLWKFNDSLLEDENYSKLIKTVIIDAIQQYAIPVYTKEYISNPQNFEHIQFTISFNYNRFIL